MKHTPTEILAELVKKKKKIVKMTALANLSYARSVGFNYTI